MSDPRAASEPLARTIRRSSRTTSEPPSLLPSPHPLGFPGASRTPDGGHPTYQAGGDIGQKPRLASPGSTLSASTGPVDEDPFALTPDQPQPERDSGSIITEADYAVPARQRNEDPLIKALKKTIEQQKRQLRSKINALGRTRDELSQTKQQYTELEIELEQKEEDIATLRKNERQYRNWWLNEIQFTKFLLTVNKIPEANRELELARASQAHYLATISTGE
ncbi:hypothetical protein BKA70DRAFT_1220279 [Coprinopsis sp. MPI-PUGE-AT-0042]|nr:hypothetical protein BKA70DRAFT_1220279 [Coprinopsis sp. MPI-PUGE-AT-0042]